VQVPFMLDKKGHGPSTNGTCQLTYTKPTKKKAGYWTATIALSKGTWRVPLANYDLNNETVKAPGRHVIVPVTVVIGNEAFTIDWPLTYIATVKKTGTAK